MTLSDVPAEGLTPVLVTALETTSSSDIVSSSEPKVAPVLTRVGAPTPEYSRFFYRAVGGNWYWVDRIPWTYAQWSEWVDAPGYELWVCTVEGSPAGYFELDRADDGNVELAYFGLLPGYTGLGLGGWLLTQALSRAWADERTIRVWVNTCDLDSPTALANYTARGLRPVGTTTEYRDLRQSTPGPWRGADRPPILHQ
jgi:GNAT superfamily N-acetyltransferase